MGSQSDACIVFTQLYFLQADFDTDYIPADMLSHKQQ